VTNEIIKALAAPFFPADIHWKPQAISGNRALAVAYLDARAVMDRLDECGLIWSDSYEVLPGGSVICRLQVMIDGHPVVKSDVGSPSEQPDDGDKMKAAFSDALKRAAVKWGIGRYLYRLPKVWCDFNPQKKQLIGQPQLPAWAMPVKPSPQAGSDEVDLGRVAVVTHEQAKELQKLLQASGTVDGAKFLARFGAKRLSEIPAAQYADALAVLKAPSQDVLRKPAA
jgi:hypothetical protein